MPDREKVIKELHDARRYLEDKEWSDRGASPHIDAINDALAMMKEQDEIIKEYEKMAELFNDAVARCRKYMEKCGAIPVEKEQKKRFLVTEKGEWIPLDKDTDVLNKIVKCKDCKYYMDGWCPEIGLVTIDPDWFCGYGKEKHGHPERNVPDREAGDGVPGRDDSVLDRSALD